MPQTFASWKPCIPSISGDSIGLRDRLKWLNGTDERLAKAESAYAANIRHRDSHTHIVKEKG